MRKKRLLFVDDDEVYLLNRKRLIEAQGGYIVYIASTLDAGREVLASRYVHLATFDVYMSDGDLTRRISGLTLVHDPTYADLVKLVVTGKPRDSEDVAEALKPRPGRRLPPAVDYVNKKEDDWRKLLQQVDAAIDKFCGINWKLDIEWPRFAFEDGLVAALNPDVSPNEWHERTEELREHSDELNDLLAIAFHDYDAIEVKRPLWQEGARLALPVIARRGSEEDDRLVIVGRNDAVSRVAEARRRFMPQYAPVGHAQALNVARPLQTLHYAAELLELPGARLDQVKTLIEHYAQAGTILQVRTSINNLLNTALRPLNPRTRYSTADENADWLLRVHAGLSEDSPEALHAAIIQVGAAAAAAGLATLHLAEGKLTIRQTEVPEYELPDPAAWLAGPGPTEFERPLAIGISCGAPSPNTILIAEGGLPLWLTDYGQIGPGPLISTLAALEVCVKFDLHPFLRLALFRDAERELLRADSLGASLDAITDFKKSFAAIERIRQAAMQYGGDTHAYRRALFYHTARRLLIGSTKLSTRDVRIPLFAGLSLGLIAQRLGDQVGQAVKPSITKGLSLDVATRQVRLDGQPLRLSPTEYRFLCYLLEHPRQFCSRQEIMAACMPPSKSTGHYGRNYPNELTSNIRTVLGPSAREYLVTMEGGYILYPDGQPD